jgi:hypothetical protein
MELRLMYRYPNLFIVCALCVFMAACSGRGEPGLQPGAGADPDGLFTGMLHHSGGECPFADGCGPSFSLLDESLSTWTPLEGRFDPEHHHLVVSVDGRKTSIDREHQRFLGDAAAPHGIKAKRYRLLSSIPYHPFLVEQASAFTTRKYGCELLWDKSYRWQQVGDRVHLIVRMTDTFHAQEPMPFLELTYDGETGHFLEEEMQPWGLNPCQSPAG